MDKLNDKQIILKQLTIACRMTGANYPTDVMDAMVTRLAQHSLPAVLMSLSRCQEELAFPVKLKDVLDRIPDGRPGADEAWALIPRDEATTVVWNDEIAEAWGIALPVLNSGDKIAARRTFIEAYNRIVSENKVAGKAPQWTPSLGSDVLGREQVLLEAVRKHRLSAPHVEALLPPGQITPQGQKLLAGTKLKLIQG